MSSTGVARLFFSPASYTLPPCCRDKSIRACVLCTRPIGGRRLAPVCLMAGADGSREQLGPGVGGSYPSTLSGLWPTTVICHFISLSTTAGPYCIGWSRSLKHRPIQPTPRANAASAWGPPTVWWSGSSLKLLMFTGVLLGTSMGQRGQCSHGMWGKGNGGGGHNCCCLMCPTPACVRLLPGLEALSPWSCLTSAIHMQ